VSVARFVVLDTCSPKRPTATMAGPRRDLALICVNARVPRLRNDAA